MVKVREDLTNKIFGRWTVIEQTEDYVSQQGTHYAQWLCECSCEAHTRAIVTQAGLKSGKSSSCGCIARESARERWQKRNKYDLSGEYGIGWTINTDKEFYFDLDVFDQIKDICWCEHHPHRNFSALVGRMTDDGRVIRMHVLLGFAEYDHIYRNELNNLRSNLRPATHQENQCNMKKRTDNTSGITGVVWNKQNQKWVAQIQYKGKVYYKGSYVNKDDAIRARFFAEIQYFGEFAPQKHLYEQYGININTIQNDLKEGNE